MSKIINIEGIEVKFSLSNRKDKKLKAEFTENGKKRTIHFGQEGYEHYFDKTGLLPKNLNHNDKKRRKSFLDRTEKVFNRVGKFTAAHFAREILW